MEPAIVYCGLKGRIENTNGNYCSILGYIIRIMENEKWKLL